MARPSKERHTDEPARSRAHAGRRALRARRAARPRRDGRGAQGHRHPPGPRRRGQAAADRPGQRRDVPGPLPPRGAVVGLAQPPRDRVGLRHRRGARHRRVGHLPALHRDGVRRRADAARHPARGPQDPARARAGDHLGRARGARLQPPRGDHPPRHQARQRDAHPERRRQGDGLRHRPRDLRRLVVDDPDRRRGGHRPVPLPRAGPRRDRRLALRRLLRRLPALRAAHRPAAVRGRQPGGRRLPARPRAGRAAVRPRHLAHPRDRRHRDEVARQAGRGPLPVGRRDARRHRALPRRSPRTRDRAAAPAGAADHRRPAVPPDAAQRSAHPVDDHDPGGAARGRRPARQPHRPAGPARRAAGGADHRRRGAAPPAVRGPARCRCRCPT